MERRVVVIISLCITLVKLQGHFTPFFCLVINKQIPAKCQYCFCCLDVDWIYITNRWENGKEDVYPDYSNSYYSDAELYEEQTDEGENYQVYEYEDNVRVDEEVEIEIEEEEEEDEDEGGQDYVEPDDGMDITDIVLTMTYIKRTKPKSCDKRVDLYDFDQPDVPVTGVTRKCHDSCNRAFISTLVAHTNLLLVVVDTTCTCHPSPTCTCQFNIKPTKVEYNAHTEGEKLKTNLYRRQPAPSSYYSMVNIDSI